MRKLTGALVALLLMSGCGGTDDSSASEPPPNPPSPSVTKPIEPTIQLADACPKVQDALDQSFKGNKILYAGKDFGAFADQIGSLVDQVDPKGVPLLTTLEEASRETARKIDADPFAEEIWFDAMDRMNDTCQQLGAPLR